MGPFEVGQILALRREGNSHRQIAERVTRGRDLAGPSLTAVGDAVCRLDADPTWLAGRAEGCGRKRKTTEAEDRAFVRAVKPHRGSRKVNATVLRGMVPAARRISPRHKTLVPAKVIPSRLAWATWVKMQRPAFLRRWVFTDGVSFFLSRTEAEHGDAFGRPGVILIGFCLRKSVHCFYPQR